MLTGERLRQECRKRRYLRKDIVIKDALHHIKCLIALYDDDDSHTINNAKQFLVEVRNAKQSK